MLPKKTKYTLYAVLLVIVSAIYSSAVANTTVFEVLKDISISEQDAAPKTEFTRTENTNTFNTKSKNVTATSMVAPMFTTIVQGADSEVTCNDNGFTVARFNLCGDFDDRVLSLSGGPYTTVQWQEFTCAPDVNEDCPDTTISCYSTVSMGQTYTLDASSISSTTGAEYRVIADGQPYYIKVKKSSITQTYVKQDYICGVDGRIQITNLSSAYEFSIDSGSGFGPWQGPIFDNLLPGTYVVKARLQNTPNTCEYPYEPITIDQLDMDIDVTFVDAQCSGETGSVTVTPTAGIGPYKYTLINDSGVAQEFTAFIADNPYTFSAVGFGTYTVQVETQQCTGDPLNGIDPPRQTLDTSGNPIVIGDGLVALDASTEVNSSFGCSTITSVDITVNTSGGAPPYTFIVNGSGPTSPSYTGTTTHTVTSPGSYDFLITDSNGCTITASSNVESLLPPDVNATGIDGTCSNGGAKINFNVTDARGYNLSYRVDPGDPWVASNQITVTADPSGTLYDQIEVRYQQGGFECTMPLNDVTVSSVGVISGTATKISDRTCDGSGGTIGGQIDFGPASGGSGSGYTFSIDGTNFTTTTSYTNLVAGTYTPMIEDGGGCRLELTPITILEVDPPTDIDFVATNSNCAANTVDLQLVPTLGTGGATIANFSIISPFVNDNGASDTFVALDATQSYIFQIRDSNGCTYTEGYSPVLTSSIRARVKSGGDLRVCNGATDGTGTFLIDGFGTNYTYNINGGTESAPQNNGEVDLPLSGQGTYTITVTDVDTGCTDTASFDIQEAAPLTLTGAVTDMSCANGNVGRVRATATGGWEAYSYTLTPPSGPVQGPKSGRTFNNLTEAGTYELLVEDTEGCTATFSFTLTPLDAPTISLDTTASDFCYVAGTGATAVVSSTAGTAPIGTHEYRINGGTLQASSTFSGLTPGNYTIEVVDDNNCTDSVNITIEAQLRVNTSLVTEIPCGTSDGRIRVNINGGYTPGSQYEVSIDDGVNFGAPITFTSNNFNYDTSVAGTYVFRVTDNQGCVAESAPLIVNPPAGIDPATTDTRDVTCGQTANGSVTITPDATSGVPPYEISFDGGAFSSQTVYSNLAVGTYPFTVRDARGCIVDQTVDIFLDTTPTPDTDVDEIPAICSASVLSGGIRINSVTNGAENFSFIIEDNTGTEVARQDNVTRAGATSLDIYDVDLVPGSYTVITIDANGCTDIDTVTITSNEVVITPIPPPAPIDCNDASFTYAVSVSGGTGSYEIKLDHQPSFYPLNNNPSTNDHTFDNTTDGITYGVAYTVQVIDTGSNCIYEQEIPPVDGFSLLEVTATSTPGACDVNRNGEIAYEVTGYTVGNNLRIELLNNADNTSIVLHSSVTTTAATFSDTYAELPGDYQVLVTNLSDTCTDAAGVVINQNLPSIDILTQEPANCNALGQITVQGRGGNGGPYTYAFVNQGDPEPAAGAYSTETTFVAPDGNYDVYVKDASGCTSFDIATVILLEPNLPTPTFDVVNQCNTSATSFDILVRMPNTVDTPRYTLGGVEAFPVINGSFWEHTYTVSSPGDYVVDVVDANGCTGQGTATVYDFLAASGEFSNESTCNNADGEITITTTGGSGDFSFDITGVDYTGAAYTAPQQINDPIFTGLLPGTYEVLVTDRQGALCDFTVTDINLNRASLPTITSEIPTNISCHNSDDGTLEIVVDPADPLFPFTSEDLPIEYILTNVDTSLEVTRNNTGSFTGLEAGRYQVEVLTARDCSVLSAIHEIINPADFAISATAPDFACEPGANRFSSTILTVSVDQPGTVGSGYNYSIEGFSNYQTSNTFEIVDNGSTQTITVYAIDGNGCQTTATPVVINPPNDVVPSIIEEDPLNCANPERVRIQVVTDPVGPVNFTVSTTSAVPVADVTNASGDDYVDIYLPVAGDYIFEVLDNNGGCTYPMPVHTVAEPITPTVVIAEAKPISCFTPGNDGELSITVTDYVGLYDYRVFSGDDPSKTTVITSGTGLDTASNPSIITGLSGGNYFVEVTSTGTPFCDSDSNIATIRTPNGNLEVTANEIGNTSCSNDTGRIEAIGTGGWDTSAYEYRLLESTDGGTTYSNEIAAFSNVNEFENLPSGDYRVEIRDVEGCINDFDISLAAVPQINAGIREPLALQCPAGNNAVLEAYDPTSGDATTATAGATGGFAGAGYNYRLLYLNSNDNTDVASYSGLQNSPTFVGASGGYISAGWYAIEVSSSFNCLFVTVPYYVDPPPPVEPSLVQTRVPGCGGAGEMRLDIENYDPSFVYEYLRIENGSVVGVYTDMVGSSVTVSGNAGISYQFDVRKKNASNTCAAVRSNGITMTDASVLTLLPNSPVDPISCASELDGRIESFANGGVGNNMFTLYIGQPIDGFNAGTATIYRGPQPDGTFEGLPEGADYWVGVTSGLTCEAVDGPFEIIRPEPIVFTADPVSVSCFGEEDGGISIEVQSGGEGLLQFAIGPNFNEFFSDPATPRAYVFDELAAGEYEILIKDDNGCFEKDFITVGEPDVLEVTNIVTTPELCIGANDGTLSFNITGGTQFNDVLIHPTPYYEYKFEKISPVDETGTGVFAPYDGQTIENLEGGASYALYIRDVNGCETTEVISITIGVDLTAEPIVEYGCEGIFPNSTTTVQMQETSLLPDLLFALDPIDPTDPVTAMAGTDYVFGNLTPGDHIVYIYHENGCTNTVEFTIDAYDPLTLNAIKTGPNELTASAEGGYGGYEFFFQGESYGAETVYTTNESTVVEVRVVDSNGCSATVTVPFEFTGMLDIPNAFTPDGDGLNDYWSPNNREFFPNIEVKIYDRYGRVVAILDNVTHWDGNYEGSPVPTGDYWYVVNANDKSKIQFVGHFTLYR